MAKQVRCPKCGHYYWPAGPHTCPADTPGAPPPKPKRGGWIDPTATDGCCLVGEAGCCILEIISGCVVPILVILLLIVLFH